MCSIPHCARSERLCHHGGLRWLWIALINADARLNGTTYSRLMHERKVANILLNRKRLADPAVRKPQAFAAIVAKTQA